MGVTPPGWYEDQDDPTLARWWDGDRWTEHTLVIAEQVPNVQPPPPPGYAPAGSQAFLEDDDDWNHLEDEGWADATLAGGSIYDPIADPRPSLEPDPDPAPPTSVFSLDDEDPPVFAGTWDVQEPYQPPPRGLADQYRGLPPWMRVAIPSAVALLLLVAVVAIAGALGGDDDGGGDDEDTTTTTILDPVRVRSAALVAAREAALPSLTTSTFADLIPIACEAAREDDTRELAAEIRELRLDDPTLDRLLVGLEAGAEDYCPRDMAANADLIDDLYRSLGVVPGAATSTSSSSSSTSSSSTSTTAGDTTTTRRTTTTSSTTTSTSSTTTSTSSTTTSTSSTTTTSSTIPSGTDGGTDSGFDDGTDP